MGYTYRGAMPWKNVIQMDEISRFVMLAQSDRYPITELCGQFDISRQTRHESLSATLRRMLEGRSDEGTGIGQTVARPLPEAARQHQTSVNDLEPG